MREERERERREKRTTNVPAWTGLYRKCTLCCVLAVAGDAHGEERQDGHTVSLSLSFSLTLRFLTLSATSSRDGVRKRRVEDGRTEGGKEGRERRRGGGSCSTKTFVKLPWDLDLERLQVRHIEPLSIYSRRSINMLLFEDDSLPMQERSNRILIQTPDLVAQVSAPGALDDGTWKQLCRTLCNTTTDKASRLYGKVITHDPTIDSLYPR